MHSYRRDKQIKQIVGVILWFVFSVPSFFLSFLFLSRVFNRRPSGMRD